MVMKIVWEDTDQNEVYIASWDSPHRFWTVQKFTSMTGTKHSGDFILVLLPW